MSGPKEYTVEWFREIYRDNPKWLGTQALKLWEHYLALEARLEALENVHRWAVAFLRAWNSNDELTHNEEISAYNLERALNVAQEEQGDHPDVTEGLQPTMRVARLQHPERFGGRKERGE